MGIVYLNGKFIEEHLATISPLDRGFLFGDSVYEVIPVYYALPLGLEKHLNRLLLSLKVAYIPAPNSVKELSTIISALLDKNNSHTHQKIYIQITRGESTLRNHAYEQLTPTVYMRIDSFTPKSYEKMKQGIKVLTSEDNRWNKCHIKSTSLMPNVLHIIDATKRNYDEIILTSENYITEGASSNIFIVKDGSIYTPIANNQILGGITRELVIKSAKSLGITMTERHITTEELLNADEVWITSSTREILPVHTINTNTLIYKRDVWHKVYSCYQQYINGSANE